MITLYIGVMKILILSLIVLVVISCQSPKTEIVEQIKSYRDSLTIVSKQQLYLTLEISKMHQLYTGQQAIDSVYALEMRQSPLKAELFVKRINFESRIDSLELELKKY